MNRLHPTFLGFFLGIGLFLLPFFVPAEDMFGKEPILEPGVLLEVETGEIVVWSNSNSLLGGVGVALIKAPPERVWEIITDYNGHENYMPGISQSRAIPNGDNQFLLYTEYETPWPFETLYMESNVLHQTDDPEHLRMEWEAIRTNMKTSVGGWHVKPYKDHTLVIHRLNFDVAFIPKVLGRSFSRQAIKFVIKEIRSRATKLT